MRIPFFDALPMPAKKLSGMDITSAQGQEITRNVSARSIQLPVINNGGMNAIINANITTAGV